MALTFIPTHAHFGANIKLISDTLNASSAKPEAENMDHIWLHFLQKKILNKDNSCLIESPMCRIYWHLALKLQIAPLQISFHPFFPSKHADEYKKPCLEPVFGFCL